MNHARLIVRRLGRVDYLTAWSAMRDFTDRRNAETVDELWLLEHPPVFTQGLAGKPEHVLLPGDIPVVQTDRGGQVTYHGPGQLVAYPLLDIERLGLGVRSLVRALEQAVIGLLADYGIAAIARDDAPGVYVDDAKIASLGLKIRRGCCYHGLALNVDGDLSPFSRINPCGLAGQRMARLSDFVDRPDTNTVANALVRHLAKRLGLDGSTAGPDDEPLPVAPGKHVGAESAAAG
ncbi:MAG: lipoyl(octanoyl) transferase LipB [Wenzhouxiangellaceae bacterium]|nr:lipoyl(octanoyl) transferase LipB [Wenzhouxiangellaceae bacterium]